MVFTNPVVQTSPHVVTDTEWNELVNNWKYINVDNPRCAVFLTANQTLTTGVSDFVDWDGERFDSGAMHDNVVNPEEIILNRTGIWRLHVNLRFGAHAAGTDTCQMEVEGILLAEDKKDGIAGRAMNFSLSALYQTLGTTDIFRVNVSQDSGGPIDIERVSNYYSLASAVWIGDNV